jgi:CSLREA domain-containing protein
MTSKSQKHSIVGFLQLSGKKSARGVLFSLALGLFFVAPAQAAVFTVNSPADPPAGDANPGNGVCETAAGNGVCTLRAAIQEANALAGDDTIILSPNTYLLTQVTELTITGHLMITGGGAATTIIDGNKGVRTNSGVLVIGPGVTVSISGVTIRNGGRTGFFVGGGIFNVGNINVNQQHGQQQRRRQWRRHLQPDGHIDAYQQHGEQQQRRQQWRRHLQPDGHIDAYQQHSEREQRQLRRRRHLQQRHSEFI